MNDFRRLLCQDVLRGLLQRYQARVPVLGFFKDNVETTRLMYRQAAAAFQEDAAGVVIGPAVGVLDEVARAGVLGQPSAQGPEACTLGVQTLQRPRQWRGRYQ